MLWHHACWVSSRRVSSSSQDLGFLMKRLWRLFPSVFTDQSDLCAASHDHPSGLERPFSFWNFWPAPPGTSMYFGCRYVNGHVVHAVFHAGHLLIPLIDWLAVTRRRLSSRRFACPAGLAQWCHCSLRRRGGSGVKSWTAFAFLMFVSALFWGPVCSKPYAIYCVAWPLSRSSLRLRCELPPILWLICICSWLHFVSRAYFCSLNIDFTLAARYMCNFCGCWGFPRFPSIFSRLLRCMQSETTLGRRFWFGPRIFWFAGLLRLGWC